MKKVIIGFLASLGFLALIAGVGIYFTVQTFLKSFDALQDPINEVTLLKVQVGAIPFVDVHDKKSFLSFMDHWGAPSLFETVTTLHSAAYDPRIKGVLVEIAGSHLTLAQAQELREALTFFKKNKKPIRVFAYSFGEGSNGTTPYYLATIADSISMQPQGSVELSGYALESYFLKDLFDKHKIKPQLARREGYKGIIETYTRNDFSPETKKNLSNVLENMLDQVQETLALQKGIDKKATQALFEASPYMDKQAVHHTLVTQLIHRQEGEDLFKKDLQASAVLSLKSYKKHIKSPSSAPKIALVSIEGEITSDVQDSSYGLSQKTPKSISDQLRKAGEDNTICALILRVNSPGGTVKGAEMIWHEVDFIANTLKKPVIVSMGTLAASAGYQIAAPATKIIANGATITGSIGVATGKIVLGDAAANLGIHLQQVQTPNYSGMWSMQKEFSPDQWRKIEESLDHYYGIFLEKVSTGRHLAMEKVRDLAKGQVWTGQQAKTLGLVDELGGLLTAIQAAKQLCHLPEHDPVAITFIKDSPLSPYVFLTDLFESLQLIFALSQTLKDGYHSLSSLTTPLSSAQKITSSLTRVSNFP